MKIFLLSHAERYKDTSQVLSIGAPLDPNDLANRHWWEGLAPHDKFPELTVLTPAGEEQASIARERIGLTADIYFSSKSTHAWQTAQRLMETDSMANPSRLLTLWALTPGGEVSGAPLLSLHDLTFHHITTELAQLAPAPLALKDYNAVVFVGHHPRIDRQLFRDLTRHTPPWSAPAEFAGLSWAKARGVHLEGSYEDLCQGKAATVGWI